MSPQLKGGLVTLRRYGRQHYVEIGRKGFETMVNRHFAGNKRAACDWLAKKGRFAIDNQITSYGRKFADPGPHPAHKGD